MYDTIIIGGGPAGSAAGIYAARKKLNTLLVAENIGGQILKTWEIENYPGFLEETGASLGEKFTTHLNKFKVEIKNEIAINVNKINSSCFQVRTKKNQYESKTLILAMGKTSRPLNARGEEKFRGAGVTYCATCDGPLFANKIVAVVGGGNAGLETAIQMEKIAARVYLLEKGKECQGDPLLLENVQNQPKTKIMLDTEIIEIYGENFVQGVKIKNSQARKTQDLKLDGVFVEIGSVPNTALTKNMVRLDAENRIKIDKWNATSAEGIFACGDATDIPYNQIVIAAGEGAKAAISAFNYLAKTTSDNERN
ncbi:thioredoxin-disulfide reductase [bacterium (Candidatus Torokbacteria) CG09_land_8_20_14_0_10_42_11]|nr:MAG: thioredoxin-disulfide reductase [bacterium (Candidatus Torokbacteria) CG09_land_8_20_14_0_10_42_11]